MGAVVFDDKMFDFWLTKKSEEILSKVDRETISSEEMLTLILKAQTNHFHHVDIEFRGEFKSIKQQFFEVQEQFDKVQKQFDKVQKQFDKVQEQFQVQSERVDLKFEKMEQKFEDRFDKIWSFQKWQTGLFVGLFAGIYLKLFFD